MSLLTDKIFSPGSQTIKRQKSYFEFIFDFFLFHLIIKIFNTLYLVTSSSTTAKENTKCTSKLKNELKLLKQWSKNTNLVFNCEKTKSMLFSTHKMSQHHQLYNDILKITCNNQTIESVQQYKLLGVIIDKHFSFIHI